MLAEDHVKGRQALKHFFENQFKSIKRLKL